MRRTVFAVFGAAALVLGVSSAAKADAFLSLSSGGSTISCDTSAAVVVGGNCDPAFFAVTTNLHGVTGDTVSLVPNANFAGYNLTGVSVTGNQPGGTGGLAAQALDSKTGVTNLSATAPLTVNFAEDGYSLPLGNPLSLTASQAGTFTQDALAVDRELFTGYGVAGNSLAVPPPGGTADVTPPCVNPSPGPGVESCSTVGPGTTFARPGTFFSLSGTEIITLALNDTATFTGTVNANALPGVPEPATLFMFGTGVAILGRRLRKIKKA
jgi:hypothetical protein